MSCPRPRAPPRAARSSTSCRCARASASRRCSPRATSPRRKYLVFATRNGHRQEDRVRSPTTRRSRPTASSRSTSATTTSCSPCAPSTSGDEIIMVSRAGLTRALRRVRRARDGPRHHRRARHGRRRRSGEVIAMDVARDDMDLLVVTENGYGKRTQISQYRKTNRGAKGVKTIGLTEQQGRARRRARRARAPGARVHLRRRHGPAHRRRAASPAGPLRHGRARDEPQGRRRRQRRRAGRRAPTSDDRRRTADARRTPRRRAGAAADEPRPRRRTASRALRTSSPSATLARPEKGGGPYVD